MPAKLARAPHFGVYHLSLADAGLLIAKCLWFQGEIRINFKADKAVDYHCKALEKAIAKPAGEYCSKLILAINENSLPAEHVRRDLDGVILPEVTYVEAFTLANWLEERGVTLGGVFEEDYLQIEASISAMVAEYVAAQRLHIKQTHDLTMEQLNAGAETLFLRHKVLTLEKRVEELTLPKRLQHPISERQNSSYLNIIGALLGLLLGKTYSGQPMSMFKTQQAIIDGIHAHFGEHHGLSRRNLEAKFAEAKRMLDASRC